MSNKNYDRRLACNLLTAALSALSLAISATASAQVPVQQVLPEDDARALVARLTTSEKIDQLVNHTPAILRLDVPAYNWLNEALHGVVSDLKTTNFPEPIGLAASFNPSLVYDVATVIGDELIAVHAAKRAAGHLGPMGTGLDVWAPNLNIFRDPRWGRGQETYGEDPYLTARMGVAYVTGIQGPNAARPRAIATPKHFAVHSGPERSRHIDDVAVSSHDLEDTYLPAFRAAVVEGRAGSIMCAYNGVNGTPACANSDLLQTKLRGDWGFKGYVVSDCAAVTDLHEPRRYAPDAASAVGLAFRAGMDNECTVEGFFGASARKRYEDALATGKLTQQDVDRSLLRLFTARFRIGAIEPLGANDKVRTPIISAHAAALAQRSAEESIVLLKNDGILPLRPKGLRIAVIGPLARATRVMRGNYSSGNSPRTLSIVDGMRRGLPGATIEEAIAGPFEGDGDAIPTTALRTPEGKPGLRAEYFPAAFPDKAARRSLDEILDRKKRPPYAAIPIISRIEPKVEVFSIAAPGGLPNAYRAVWSGYLVPTESGVYRVGLRGSFATLTLAGKRLAEIGKDTSGLGDLKEVKLAKGKRYAIRVIAEKDAVADTRLVWKRISQAPDEELKRAVATADIVVAVVGLTSDLEGEEIKVEVPGFDGGDRTSLDLPVEQRRMLEMAKASGKPLVVVLMNGSAINLAWAQTNANAIVEAWYPGQAGGAAVTRVLSGAVNPAGRLPLTFYRNVKDLPPFGDYAMANRTYRYFKGEVVYPFGFGLSYTDFAYSDLKLTPVDGGIANGLTVTATLANIGRVAGDEVVQLYLSFPEIAGAPNIALRGVQRLALKPGERRTVRFDLSPRDLSSVSNAGIRRVAAGQYGLSVGGGQPGHTSAIAKGGFAVVAEIGIPK